MVDEFPVLHTQHLVLREFDEKDIPMVFDLYTREIVVRTMDYGVIKNKEQAARIVQHRIDLFRKMKEKRAIKWAIALRGEPEKMLGQFSLVNLDKNHRRAELGYDLHPDYWNQGLMTEAIIGAIPFAFSDVFGSLFGFRLNRLEAMVMMNNIGSMAVLRKAGFHEEGVLRQYGYWKSAFHDLNLFSLLREDWENQEAK